MKNQKNVKLILRKTVKRQTDGQTETEERITCRKKTLQHHSNFMLNISLKLEAEQYMNVKTSIPTVYPFAIWITYTQIVTRASTHYQIKWT